MVVKKIGVRNKPFMQKKPTNNERKKHIKQALIKNTGDKSIQVVQRFPPEIHTLEFQSTTILINGC